MERQALEIASWGENVYVKIPVTNTRGESSAKSIRRLARAGVKQNVTAIVTLAQVREVWEALAPARQLRFVFAGRIADTGRDPLPMMAAAVELLRPGPRQELIWASPRDTEHLPGRRRRLRHHRHQRPLKKLSLVGKDLGEYSLETVKMFYDDACAAGLSLPEEERVAA